MSTEERVIKIVCEQLGIKETDVSRDDSFCSGFEG